MAIKQYWKYLAVFLAMAVTDGVWAQWMTAVANHNALEAAFWTTGTIILGAFVVVSYVENKRLVLPAALGGAIGTYISMKLSGM